MFEGRRLLVAFWVASTPLLRGQSLERGPASSDTLAEPTRLRMRADSLLREWRRANTVADVVDSIDRARAWAASETMSVGSLRIVANPSPLPLHDAAARVWRVLDSLYGDEARHFERRPLFVVAVDPDTTVARPVVRGGLMVTWDLDADTLALLLLANLHPLDVDPALVAWLGGSLRPTVHPERQRARVYVELVTTPWAVARDCFLQNLEHCGLALDLTRLDESPESWLQNPAERRVVVSRFLSSLSRGAQARAFHDCTNNNDSACVVFLRSIPREAVPRPLTSEARKTLVDVALQLGGRDAYHRLVANPDSPMAARLAKAAGVRIDSVIARWRAVIVASRPASVALPPWGLWIAITWTVCFAACALRSSRWRVN
ncbi:MAG TPA: hypothetical protein VGA20_02910 [Gemmatimonadales bacterium]